MNKYLTMSAASCLLAGSALAQPSNISPGHKFAWTENTGWLNLRDAGSPATTQGVRIASTFLSGSAWCENLGWINFGNGSPANGFAYTNASGLDFGVNRDSATGALGGLAWGENIGWINFGWAPTDEDNRPRFESSRLRGYAWGENIGWINLDDDAHFVGLGCPADIDDGSGTGTGDDAVTIDDLLYFLVAFEAGDIHADLDNGSGAGVPDGGVTIDDLLYFLIHFEIGC